MKRNELTSLQEILELSRQIAAKLAPLSINDPNDYAVRLAHAHALGLVDQLAEMVDAAAPRDSGVPAHMLASAVRDDELLHV